MLTNTIRWSHAPDNQVVPSRWQATSERRMGDSNPRGLAPNTLSNCVFRCSGESAHVYLCRSTPVADEERTPSTAADK